MKPIRSVNIWGDSILKGIVYYEQEGKYRPYRQCAVQMLTEHFPEIAFKNYSRFGNTITKAEEMLGKALSGRTAADCTLIEFGGNDCDFNWKAVSAAYKSDHAPNTDIEVFRQTLGRMICSLREAGSMPVIMNLPPIDAQRYFAWFCRDEATEEDHVLEWLREKQIIYRTQERYSHAADLAAREWDVPLLDVRMPFLGIRNYADYLCIDGIHLNEKGQGILGNIMIKEFEKMLRR